MSVLIALLWALMAISTLGGVVGGVLFANARSEGPVCFGPTPGVRLILISFLVVLASAGALHFVDPSLGGQGAS